MKTYKIYLIYVMSICFIINSYASLKNNTILNSTSIVANSSERSISSIVKPTKKTNSILLTTTIWNGTTWDNGTPDINTITIIDGDYTTLTNGGFSAWSLQVNAGKKLVVSNNTFVEVQMDVTVDGDLWVETCGALVQIDETGTFTLNGSGNSLVQKYTSALNNWNDYTYWSSPVSNAVVNNVFSASHPYSRFWFNASNYLDNLAEIGNTGTYIIGQDDIDDDGNDWTLLGGTDTLTPGVGYATTHSPAGFVPGNTYPYVFNGPLNTGTITVPVQYNGNNGDRDWNFIGNPYPSAISVDAFFEANQSVIGLAVYLWSHATPASNNTNGNQSYNYNADDYAVVTCYSGEIAGGTNVIPNRFIPSGQGFFVQAIDNGNVVFTNDMRMKDTTSNSQFFRSNNSTENKLWVNLTSDNGVFNQLLMAYVEGASRADDGLCFDASRNMSSGTPAIIYSIIDEEVDKKYAIQGIEASSLDTNEVFSIGFYNTIDQPTQFSLSIGQTEGSFMTSQTIYLKDNLLNNIHDLTASAYTFTSPTGEFNDRFEIRFNVETLGVSQEASENALKIIDINSNTLQFEMTNHTNIKAITMYDALGREVQYTKSENSMQLVNVSNLQQAMYIAKVELETGAIVTKKVLKHL